jgi:hypothetical protein
MGAPEIWWIVAPVLTGLLVAVWGAMSGKRIGWICLAISFLPIVVMTAISGPELSNMASRVLLSGTVGAVAGALLLIGAVEVFHVKAEAQVTEQKQPEPPSPVLNAPNNQGIVTQGQSGGTNIINPAPIITASPQVQSRSNDPAAPWQTMFTISATASVQTGDLRLACSGPCLKAGIGRINKFGFASGSNGPVPGDPNSVIYELSPETLSPGQSIAVGVFSAEPVTVVSGTIGAYKINF